MDNRTDEKWYNKEYGMDIKKVLIFVGIVLIIAAAFYTYGALNSERRVPVLPGEVILHGNTSFQYADEKVQKAGYIPTGEVTKVGVATCQMYKSSEAFGYKTKGSETMFPNRHIMTQKKIGRNEQFAQHLLDDAARKAEDLRKETILAAKEEVLHLMITW